MDFVVIGFGLGALVLLLGMIVQQVGPTFFRVPRTPPLAWAVFSHRRSRLRTCRAAGRMLAIAGGGICTVTFLALVAGVNDRVGAGLVLTAVLFALLGFLAWIAVFLGNEGRHDRGRRRPRELHQRRAPSGVNYDPDALVPGTSSVMTNPSALPLVLTELNAVTIPVEFDDWSPATRRLLAGNDGDPTVSNDSSLVPALATMNSPVVVAENVIGEPVPPEESAVEMQNAPNPDTGTP